MDNLYQLVLDLTSEEKAFLERIAKETSLSISDLVVLSVLSLEGPKVRRLNIDG